MKLFASTLLASVLATGILLPAFAQVQPGLNTPASAAANPMSSVSVASPMSSVSAGTGYNNNVSHMVNKMPSDAFRSSAANALNPVSTAGILSDSTGGHQKGIMKKVLEGAATVPTNAVVSLLLGGTDLPPDDASAPEWPFINPHRKTLATVTWTDGSTAKMSRLPDGSYQILGGGRRYVMQPESEGSFALFGDYGSMATVTRRPGGGFTIIKADGHIEQVVPREGGGFLVQDNTGVIATILPGMDGGHHVMRGGSTGSLF